MCMPKAPKMPGPPAAAPMVAPIDKAMAPTLAGASSATTALMKKRNGTKALRVDLTAPQGGSGLQIK